MPDGGRPYFWVAPALASYPALYIASSNVGEFGAAELALILLTTAAGGAAVYEVVRLLARAHGTPRTRGLAAIIVVGWLFVGIALLDVASGAVGAAALRQPEVAVPLTGALALLAVWLVLRGGREREVLGRLLTTLVFSAAALALIQLAVRAVTASHAAARSEFVRARTAPVPDPAPGAARYGTAPDVYLIVLDKYASSAMLRERFGYSNASFDDSLRRLGFVVQDDARSNYPYTMYSIASLLNMEHVDGATDTLGGARTLALYRMIEDNRAVEFLKRRGYRFHFFPSHMFVGTRRNRHADVQHHVATGGALRAVVSRSQLAHTLWTESVPGRLARPLRFDLRNPELDPATLAAMRAVAAERGPKIVVAHLMLTHEPFFFDAECRVRELLGRGEADTQAYLAQIACANRLLLETVTAILASSPSPPVILLQADHGTQSTWSGTADPDPAQREERFRAYAAYHLPDGGAAAIGGAVTPVNLLRFVLRYYHGAPLAALADEQYWESL